MAKLNASDNDRYRSKYMWNLNDYVDSRYIEFRFSPNLPEHTTISNATLYFEWQRSSQYLQGARIKVWDQSTGTWQIFNLVLPSVGSDKMEIMNLPFISTLEDVNNFKIQFQGRDGPCGNGGYSLHDLVELNVNYSLPECYTDEDCDDNNECTSEVCQDYRCIRTNLPESTACEADGLFCTVDHCDGQGHCVEYSCDLINSYCCDNDPNDGVNDYSCGALCDQDSDCLQSTSMCDYEDKKYCTRDEYGTCSGECSCVEDEWNCGSSNDNAYCSNCNHCGDGEINCDEDCDGTVWPEGVDGCEDVGNFNYGTLSCGSDCKWNTSQCGLDTQCPVVEVLVPPDTPDVVWYSGIIKTLAVVSDYQTGVKEARVIYHNSPTWRDPPYGLGYIMTYNSQQGRWEYDWDSTQAPIPNQCSIVFVQVFGEDNVGNGKNNECSDTNRFGVDNSPPVTTKEVGEPNINEYYVTTATPINLTASDCGIGVDYIHYEIWWDSDNDSEVDQKIVDQNVSGNKTTIYFTEDSIHEIRWYAVDKLGNKEQEHVQEHAVDILPPVITKEFIGPTYYNETEGKRYIDGVTVIQIDAEDQEPHPVGEVTCDWDYEVLDGEKQGQGALGLTPPFNISLPEESTHLVNVTCRDALGNEAFLEIPVVVDKTAPTTTLSYGEPNVTTESAIWINSSTPIILTIEDTGEHKSGIKETKYRVTLVGDGNCTSQQACEAINGEGEWQIYDTSFTISEDSCHLIEFYSVDNVNKTEDVKKKCIFVDNKGPTVEKSVGEPRYPCEQGENCSYYINQSTLITLQCIDQQPHPVGGDKIYYRYRVDDEDWTEWILYEEPFNFKEDSVHEIEYYCVDKLGNVGQVTSQTDKVDTVAPTTTKTYGTPYFTNGTSEWITSQTPITLQAEDGGEACAVGVNETYYRIVSVGDEYCTNDELCQEGYEIDEEWQTYTQPFTISEDSCHLIEFYSVDKLGNTEAVKRQCVFVDNAPTIPTKIVGEPNVSCKTESQTVTLFSDDFEGYNYTYGPQLYSEMNGKGWYIYDYAHPYPYDDIYLDGPSTDRYVVIRDNSYIIVSINTTGYENITLTYARRTMYAEYYDRLRIGWRVGSSGPWIPLENVLNNTWGTKTWKLIGAENKSLIQIRFFMDDGNGDLGLVDDVIVTGETKAPECDYYVSQKTSITLTCEDDTTTHPVGEKEVCYKVGLNGEDLTATYCEQFGGDMSEGWCCNASKEYMLYFMEDSEHTLEYYCVDLLGNKNHIDSERFRVDTVAPITTKTVGEPKVEGNRTPIDYYITSNTKITLSCSDQGPHPVGEDKIYYRYYYNESWTDWTEYTQPFSFPEECLHKLEYYCVDKLGNEEEVKSEIDEVDNTPPEILKVWVDDCSIRCDMQVKIFADVRDAKVGVKEVLAEIRHVTGPKATIIHLEYNSTSGLYEATWTPSCTYEEGTYYISIIASDHLGNSREWRNATWVNVDNTEPQVLWVFSGKDWVGYGTTFYVAGKVEDNSLAWPFTEICEPEIICAARIVDNKGKESVLEGSLTFNREIGKCTGFVTVNETFDESPANLYVDAWDNAGNYGDHTYTLIGIDNTPPIKVSFETDPEQGSTIKSGQRIWYRITFEQDMSGIVSPCYISINETRWDASPILGNECSGYYDVPSGLEDGVVKFILKVQDEAGNWLEDSINFILDNTPPTIELLQPGEGPYDSLVPIEINITDQISPIASETVQYRIFEPPAWYSPWLCLFGICPYDSGWLTATYNSTTGTYQDIFNATELEEGKTYFLSIRGCDILYDSTLFTVNSVDPYHCAMR